MGTANSSDRLKCLNEVAGKIKWHIGLMVDVYDYGMLVVESIIGINEGPINGTVGLSNGKIIYYYVGQNIIYDFTSRYYGYQIILSRVHNSKIGGCQSCGDEDDEGIEEGIEEGTGDGTGEGNDDGIGDDNDDGIEEGNGEGNDDGIDEGNGDGDGTGEGTGEGNEDSDGEGDLDYPLGNTGKISSNPVGGMSRKLSNRNNAVTNSRNRSYGKVNTPINNRLLGYRKANRPANITASHPANITASHPSNKFSAYDTNSTIRPMDDNIIVDDKLYRDIFAR